MLITSTLMLSACNGTVEKELSSPTPSASTICSGTTILNVAGTADCSGSGPIAMLSFASRKDNEGFPYLPGDFAAFFASPERVVASLKDEQEENSTFTENHSVIPGPLADSDGRYAPCLYHLEPTEDEGVVWVCSTSDAPEYPEKRHYLETIAKNGPITARAQILACGASGTIEARIADCSTRNGLWAFYDGKKYGQDGEGDWKLVSVLDNAGTKFEVWRDERTKLLWSDKASASYNWYQAAGYAKTKTVSIKETQLISEPGITHNSFSDHRWEPAGYHFDGDLPLQPANPISVCPDVLDGEIAAGGGTPTYTYVNPETDFKAGLSHPQTTWRLPTKNDWLLAEVNGIRKVLPNMDSSLFWSSSTFSWARGVVWIFIGDDGQLNRNGRGFNLYSVRCVASWRD